MTPTGSFLAPNRTGAATISYAWKSAIASWPVESAFWTRSLGGAASLSVRSFASYLVTISLSLVSVQSCPMDCFPGSTRRAYASSIESAFLKRMPPPICAARSAVSSVFAAEV